MTSRQPHRPAARRRTGLALAAGAAALAAAGPAAPTAAAKARIELAPTCYLSGDEGALVGTGFEPNATWSAKLNGRHALGRGRTDSRGRIRARFTAPRYEGRTGTREYRLAVTDGPNVARTTFLMSPLDASFSPESGDPARLRVRWRVLGIGPNRGVWVHYIRPNGKVKRSVRIGTSDEVCGALKTSPRRLFPFRYEFGLWRFQIDTRRRWSPRTTPRLEIRFEVRRPSRSRRG